MIELLLQAERQLSVGQLDAAERLYWQAIENDPKNSIAVVGLARVSLDRGDDRTAYQFARKALEIDGENAAALRLVARLGEVTTWRSWTICRPAIAVRRRVRPGFISGRTRTRAPSRNSFAPDRSTLSSTAAPVHWSANP